jgi:methylmalonyl-CoA/ethylmalonyl-CoA epimerase
MDAWFELAEPDDAAWVSTITGGADLGPLAVDHIGIAVPDIDEAIARYRAWFGVRNWAVSSFTIRATYRGRPDIIGGRTAIVSFGPVRIELVEPTQGSWTAVDVLASQGGGLYHLGFLVPDVAAALESSGRTGMTTELLAVHDGVPLFAYVVNSTSPSIRLEFIGRRYPNEMITAAAVVD